MLGVLEKSCLEPGISLEVDLLGQLQSSTEEEETPDFEMKIKPGSYVIKENLFYLVLIIYYNNFGENFKLHKLRSELGTNYFNSFHVLGGEHYG